MTLSLLGFAFTACEDVPEPYHVNTEKTQTDVLLSESFSSSLGKFQSKAANGDLEWIIDYSSAVITGYKDFNGTGQKTNKAGVTYLVSPAIDLTDVVAAYVSLSQAINYEKSTIKDDHKLLVSTNYANNVNAATWVELPLTFDGVGGSFTFVDQQVQIPDSLMGKKINLALKHTAHDSYSSTWEVKNFKVQKGQASSGGGGDTPTPQPTEGEGSGTAEDPYNVAAALSLIQSLGADVNSAEVYIKGKISEIKSIDTGQYGNAEYYISDDGTTTNQLLVYRGYGLNGDKFKSADAIKVGDEVVIVGKVVNFKGNTPEVTTGSKIYKLNGEGGGGDTPTPVEGKGAGTQADPYNVAKALSVAGALAADVQTEEVYIKGIISEIKSIDTGNFGNAEYYISDDGTKANQLLVYRGYGLNGDKFKSANDIKVGDEVVIAGKLVNFRGNTLEVTTGSKIVSINGEGGGTTPTPQPSGEGTGSGTLEDPYNAVAATSLATALGSGNTSSESYYIKGKISDIKYPFDAEHGTATFFISDDGTTANQFQVYSAYYLGNRSWATGDTQIKVGDDVIVYGQLTNYNGTPETASKKSYIYSLNGTTEGGDTPSPTPNPGGEGTSLADFTNGDFETWADGIPTGWQSTTTASMSGVLSQSTDAHGGSYSVKLVGNSSGNKRLAYKELVLEAGDYTVTFYVKGTADGCSIRPGYVPVTDGKVGSYVYGDYTNDIPASSWTQVTYTFSLASQTTVNLVLMNPKNPGLDVLIDDYSIVKN